MPTFNQLVKKGRQTSVKKSTAPALQKGYNSLKKRSLQLLHFRKGTIHLRKEQLMSLLHRREAYVQLLRQLHLRSLTQLLERSPEFVFLTESK